MPDPEKPASNEATNESEAPQKKGGAGAITKWLAPLAVTILFVALGFVVGRLFGARGKSQNASAAESAGPPAVETRIPSQTPGAAGSSWFYDTEPVIVNLNEPGVSRYVRVSLTLEMGNGFPQKEGTVFLDQKRPLLKHWLTLFLSNETADDIRGEKNLRQLQANIMDMFNQGLFPDSKPRITRVLFKELSTQ
jgi:flagellar basal body-associated protein FliL